MNHTASEDLEHIVICIVIMTFWSFLDPHRQGHYELSPFILSIFFIDLVF